MVATLSRIVDDYGYWALLVSLLLTFVASPFLNHEVRLYNVFVLTSLVLASLVVSSTKKRLVACVCIGLPFLAASIAHSSNAAGIWYAAFLVFGTCFFSLVVGILLKNIFTGTRGTTNDLLAAASVYLCLAVIWAMLFGLVGLLEPNTPPIRIGDASSLEFDDLIYFSIVTLTTLGYGDLAPVTSTAKSLAAVEALVGQIYLTVLVARLVGMNIEQTQPAKE